MRRGSTADRHEPLTTAYDPQQTCDESLLDLLVGEPKQAWRSVGAEVDRQPGAVSDGNGRDRAAGWNPCSIRGRTLWIASASHATMNSNCRTAAEADMPALRARLKLEHLDLKRSRRSVATA
jgi:hypothetical protein